MSMGTGGGFAEAGGLLGVPGFKFRDAGFAYDDTVGGGDSEGQRKFADGPKKRAGSSCSMMRSRGLSMVCCCPPNRRTRVSLSSI